jgi:chromosome segregation ATPase
MANGDAALRQALAEAKAAVDRLTRANADLAAKVEAGAAELRAVTDERNQLREQAAATRRGGSAQDAIAPTGPVGTAVEASVPAVLERLLAATRAELEACAAERSQMSSRLSEAVARAEASARQLEPLRAELRRASEAAASAAAEIADHVRRGAELAAERDQARARGAELDKEAAELRKALAACEAAGAKLSRDNAALARQAEGAAAQLRACVAERAELTERVEAEAARTAALARDLRACTAERERLAAESAEARSRAEGAADRLKGIEAELRKTLQATARAEAELAECARRSLELSAAVDSSAAALEACRLAGAEAERRATEAEAARIALDDRLVALQAESGLRESELAELRERVTGDQAHVIRLKETMIAETAKAEMAVQQLEAVRAQHRSAIPTADLVGNLANSLDTVNRQLFESASSYRLGRTDVTLKAFLGEGGKVAFMPDAAHLTDNRALSEISVEMIPDDAPRPPQEGALVVPDLLGLTETAVVRVLASLFLKGNKAVETVAAREKHGRALRQIPPPGTPAVRGDTVLVIYGAQEAA